MLSLVSIFLVEILWVAEATKFVDQNMKEILAN